MWHPTDPPSCTLLPSSVPFLSDFLCAFIRPGGLCVHNCANQGSKWMGLFMDLPWAFQQSPYPKPRGWVSQPHTPGKHGATRATSSNKRYPVRTFDLNEFILDEHLFPLNDFIFLQSQKIMRLKIIMINNNSNNKYPVSLWRWGKSLPCLLNTKSIFHVFHLQ